MDRTYKYTFLLITLLLIIILSTQHIALAQSDCGNGLTQRLEIGGRGWIDPTPPVEGVRMRQAPGESEVARLQPGEEFIVIDGPRCFDSLSWWQIETDNGKLGWIAEGIPGGGADPSEDYFVEPLDVALNTLVQEIDLSDSTCPETDDIIEIGQFVTISSDATSSDFYMGSPRIQNFFLPVNVYYDTEFSSGVENFSIESGYVADGPVCVSNIRFYEIANAWISDEYIQIQSTQPVYEPAFVPKTLILEEPEAPLVSPEVQIAFFGGAGGGGGGYDPLIEPCRFILAYRNSCITVYPLRQRETAIVTIRQVDGVEIVSYEMVVEPFEVSLINESGGNIRTIETNGINVDVPTQFGVTEGIYIVSIETASQQIEHAYLYNPYRREFIALLREVPSISSHCESQANILIGDNFEPNETLELVVISSDNGGFTQSIQPINGEQFEYTEEYRWTFEAGDLGEFRLEFDVEMPEDGFYVMANESGDWRDNAPSQFGTGGDDQLLAEPIRNDCDGTLGEFTSVPLNRLEIVEVLVAPDDYVIQINQPFEYQLTEAAEWVLVVDEEAVVTITVESDEMDVLVELIDESGEILVQDDDSGEHTNALITDFEAPVDGTYIIKVSSWGEKSGYYTIRVTTSD